MRHRRVEGNADRAADDVQPTVPVAGDRDVFIQMESARSAPRVGFGSVSRSIRPAHEMRSEWAMARSGRDGAQDPG